MNSTQNCTWQYWQVKLPKGGLINLRIVFTLALISKDGGQITTLKTFGFKKKMLRVVILHPFSETWAKVKTKNDKSYSFHESSPGKNESKWVLLLCQLCNFFPEIKCNITNISSQKFNMFHLAAYETFVTYYKKSYIKINFMNRFWIIMIA